MKSQIVLCTLLLFFPIPLHPHIGENRPCGITNLAKVKTCRGQRLEHVPPESVIYDGQGCFKTFDLGNNNISVISNSEFSKISCKNSVQHLLLDHNVISKLSRNSFNALRSLRILDLSFNNLTNLENEFLYIENLEELILDENPIKAISRNSFRYHKKLKHLSMKNISIKRLPEEFLIGSQLETLDLSGNCVENWDEVYVPPTLKVIGPEKCSSISTTNTTTTPPSIATESNADSNNSESSETSGLDLGKPITEESTTTTLSVDTKNKTEDNNKDRNGTSEKDAGRSEEAAGTNIMYYIFVFLIIIVPIAFVIVRIRTNIAAKCFKKPSDNSGSINLQSNAPLMQPENTLV